jgi:uncharacterized repeat protein (TIGR01451 family)
VAAAALPIGTWRALGPAPIGPPYLLSGQHAGGPNSGRITGLAITQVSSGTTTVQRVVAATAGGGIWTSDNGGTSWTPRTDALPDLAIGSVAVDPANSNLLIAGTGEANQSGDSYPGDGILVSTDAGTSWTLQNPGGVFSGKHIAQVAIDPADSSIQFAATDGGLYVTTNGGTSWAKPTSPTYTPFDGNITAVAFDPLKSNIVYIAGSLGSTGAHTVAESTDDGGTWAAADNGITALGSSQFPLVALAIGTVGSTAITMYAATGGFSAPAAVYRSTDGGSSWTQLTAAPDYMGQAYSYGSGTAEQGWYDNTLAVDPANANHVLAGGIALVETTDGGSSWTNVNGGAFDDFSVNKLHPDEHALAFAPDGTVWDGNDGGVYHYFPASANKTVTDANGNLDVTQFYYGFNVVRNELLAGSQDNASARTNTNHLAPWTGIWGGDGGPSAIVSNDAPVQYIQANSNLYDTTDGFSATLNNVTPPASTGSLFTPPDFVVRNAASPGSPTAYYGAGDLWRGTGAAASPTWTQVTAHNVGGQFVSAITASANGQYVYVGWTDGTVMASTNSGVSFTPLAAQSLTDTFVTGLSINPANPKQITASFSYNDTRYVPGLPHVEQYSWSTAPGTGTWTTVTGSGLPSAVSRVVYDRGALIAATDAGVYGTGAPNGSSTVWSNVGAGLPNVQVQDLFVASSGLYAVTHGRGAWWLPGTADLSVNVGGPASFPPNSDGTYTVTVTNHGPSSALSVTMKNAVPTGTTFVSESQTGGPAFTCTNPAVGSTGVTSCKIGKLASGANAKFTLTFFLPGTTTQTSVTEMATVGSNVSPDPTTSDNSSKVTTPV